MLLKMEKQEEIISNENYKKKGKKQRDCLIHLLTGQEFRCQVSVSICDCDVNTSSFAFYLVCLCLAMNLALVYGI